MDDELNLSVIRRPMESIREKKILNQGTVEVADDLISQSNRGS